MTRQDYKDKVLEIYKDETGMTPTQLWNVFKTEWGEFLIVGEENEMTISVQCRNAWEIATKLSKIFHDNEY